MKKKIKKIKSTSDEFFNSNKKTFDVIYIDGDHYGSQVYKDCTNALKILKKNGYLICDDYFWNFYTKNEDNPCFAINIFLDPYYSTKQYHRSFATFGFLSHPSSRHLRFLLI